MQYGYKYKSFMALIHIGKARQKHSKKVILPYQTPGSGTVKKQNHYTLAENVLYSKSNVKYHEMYNICMFLVLHFFQNVSVL